MPKHPFLLAASLLLAGRVAAAEPVPPLTLAELTGPRTLALGGGVGLASGNESLFKNPAALAARKRYIADLFYVVDQRPELTGDERRQDYLVGAVADSSTTVVAAGLAYAQLMKGVETGTSVRLGLAAQLTQGFSVGLQGNYYDLHGGDRVASALNLDAGIHYQVVPLVSIGGAAYNMLHTSHDDLLPQAYAIGFAAGSESSLQVVGDWRVDLNRVRKPDGTAKKTDRFSIGAEYLFGGAVPIRGGYVVDDATKAKWWSAGTGYLSSRVALDLAFRQSTTDTRARTYSAALRVFVPAE